MMIARVATLGMALGLGGCLGMSQPPEPQALALSSAVALSTLDPEPVLLPGTPTRSFQPVRGAVEPLQTLENSGARVRKPERVRAARLAHASTASNSTNYAAWPTALDDVPGILAKVAAAQAVHQRNTDEARQRDQENERRVRRITGSICSGC
jgi:hypothetical protein